MFEDKALLEMKKGVDQIADAVKCTMGPAGQARRHRTSPTAARHVTKDGVSVAKEVELPEPFESMGAKMVHQVAKKTADKAGDGTTCATVLAQAIFTEGLKRHVAAGANPVHLSSAGSTRPPMPPPKRSTGSRLPARARATTRRSPPSRPTTTRGRRADRRGHLKVGADGVVEVEDGKGRDHARPTSRACSSTRATSRRTS